MNKTNVDEYVVKEILKNCNWIERIGIRLNLKTYVKIFKIGISFGYNSK